MKKRAWVFGAICLALAALALSGCAEGEDPVSRGMGYYREGNYEQAMACWEDAAAEGNAGAMYNIGTLYYSGEGVKQDYQAALDWFLRGAEGGSESAMRYAARLSYFDYEGLEKDYEQAAKWFGALAEKDDADAMHWLGEIYEYYLEDVAAHDAIAREWYERGASLGNSGCMYHMGKLYVEGKSVEKSEATAFVWYERAAQHGSRNAMREAGHMLCKGQGVKKDYPAAQSWLQKAVDAGDTEKGSYEWLGYLYASDLEGVETDYEKGAAYYRQAEEAGSGYAMCMLGNMYKDGKLGETDLDMAREYYQKALEAGYERAEDSLKALDEAEK